MKIYQRIPKKALQPGLSKIETKFDTMFENLIRVFWEKPFNKGFRIQTVRVLFIKVLYIKKKKEGS